MGDWDWLDQNCDIPACVAVIGVISTVLMLIFL
jgi:hypothetical protein